MSFESRLRPGHYCYIIPALQDTDRTGGFVPSLVIEDEAGHSPMLGDPTKFQAPWVWGKTLPEAEAICAEQNRKLGLSELRVMEIVTSSMRLSMHGRAR